MAGQGSARVNLKEIDLSQVSSQKLLPQGVPAAVVGPARKGPAFVPQTFANMQQFSETFGNMLERDREANSNLFGPMALNQWMQNSQAGTYLRVLGVGDGLAATNNVVTDAGFVVGSEQVQSTNLVAKNPHAEITADTTVKRNAISAKSRTHFLGCFMSDTRNANLLKDSGIQTASGSGAELDEVITVAGHDAGHAFTIFLPKEVIPSGTSDVTLTIKIVDALSATVDKNVIEIQDDGNPNSISSRIKAILEKNTLTHNTNNHYKYDNLSGIKPSEIFSVTVTDNKAKISLVSTAVEGDFVKFTQTVGTTSLLGATSKTLQGAQPAKPVIRGILMMPQGVRSTLDVHNDISGVHGTLAADGSAGAATSSNVRDVEIDDAAFNAAAGVGNLAGYEIGNVDLNQKFRLLLNGFKNEENPSIYSCSFNPNDEQYFAKVLNTDPTKIEEKGHYLYAHWDIDPVVATPSTSGLTKGGVMLSDKTNYENMSGFCMPSQGTKLNQSTANKPDYDSYTSRFRTAYSPYVVSQYYGSSDSGNRLNSSADAYKLFRLHALDDGEIGHKQFRVLISNLRYVSSTEFGSFDLSLEAFDSDPVRGEIIKTWKKLDLDVNSRNFIGRVIGDKHTFYNFDKAKNSQRLVETGRYEIKNKYVRVELSDELLSDQVPVDALPSGFIGLSHLFTNGTGNFVESLAAANSVLTDSTPAKLTVISSSQVAPLPFVKSISKITGSSTKEAVQDLAWGIKFGIKKNTDTALKETSEIEFNRSIESWTKFFPDLGATEPAWRTYDFADSATNIDAFQNNFFSLEKIQIDSEGITDDKITNWGTAEYKRTGVFTADSDSDGDGDDTRFVNISKDANGGNIRYLKFRFMMQGGFDGVNIFDKEKSALTDVAASREGLDETGSNKFTGPTVMSYRRAVDVLSDKSATEFQVLCLPGLRAPSVTDYAITSAEDRFDALLVMDIEEKDKGNVLVYSDLVRPHVRNTISQFENRVLDTSFAAAYFPDVLVRRPSDNAPIVVPPSVGMMGVLSRNDSIADPWFAPAGLQRGRLAAIDTQVQMNRDLLDELYDADINPIYVPAGRSGEVYAFGQKTLLQNQSALDRINVRRLLIDLRRKVRKVGEQLLFEPNRESTLSKFASLVEPIMQDVQSRRGVTRYKVQIDTTTTTQNDIENNTIRGKIYLQPTKSVEFISLDFVVANTIE